MSKLTEQQNKAVVSVADNVLVSAGAGSGKTHVLVERYIEILRSNPEVTVDAIVAVTFTRKAAGEMRNRLKLKFKELAEQDIKDYKRWQKCLQDIDLAKIGTIHSLCESTLKAFPAEAQIDPQFEVIDDVVQSELIEESVENALRQAISEEAPEKEILNHLNFDEVRNWLISTLKSSIQFRESFKKMMELDDQSLLAYMNDIRCRVQIDLITGLLNSKKWKQAIEYLDSEISDGKLEEQREFILFTCNTIEESFKNAKDKKLGLDETTEIWMRIKALHEINLRIGKKDDRTKALKDEMRKIRNLAKDVTEDLPDQITLEDMQQFDYCRWLVALFERADKIYLNRKQKELAHDYNDLIALTANLLRLENSAARKYFQDKLHAILVDEFQDTNSMQADVVSMLAGKNTRLFLIGDDKQSIYKFQGADVSTFNMWRDYMKERASASSGERHFSNLEGNKQSLKLTMSFRSHPKVVDFVNFVFAKVFQTASSEAQADTSYRALFEPLKAARLEDSEIQLPEGHSNIDIVSYTSDESESVEDQFVDSYDMKRKESIAVADWILDKIDSKAPLTNAEGKVERTLTYGDFAVLVHKNSDFEAIEYGLSQRKIPYSVFAGRGFLNRQEIIDIENILRFLSNRRDSHSLLGVLRSPILAVSDDVIHELNASGKSSLWKKLQSTKLSSKPGYEHLRKAVILLRHLVQDAATLNLSELIRSIIVRTNYELVLLNSKDGVQRARNLFKIVAIAKDYESMTLAEFAHHLSQMREFKIKQSDAPIGTSDSVKIMTIHASKGLEFPCVALPALGGEFKRSSNKLIYHPTYGIAINSERDRYAPKPAWYAYARKLDHEMEIAECHRLFYVAMTRARDYLAMFIDDAPKNTDSFRKWIVEALDLDLQEFEKEPKACVARSEGLEASFSTMHYQPKEELEEEDQRANLPESVSRESLNLKFVDQVSARRVDITNNWPQSSRITPASLNKDEDKLPANLIGNYFHKLMECVVSLSDYPDSKFFENVAYDLGIVASHPDKRARLVAEGEKLLSMFWQSKLHTKMAMSLNRYEEFPYIVMQEESIKSKRPDLILEDEHNQWFIVDFKTDDFHLHMIDSHINRHRRQLNGYVKELGKLTGITYIPAIYFARHGKFVEIDKWTSQEDEGKDSLVKQADESVVTQLKLF